MLCQTVLDYPWNKDQNPSGTRIVFTAKTGGLLSRKVGAPSCWQAVASRALGWPPFGLAITAVGAYT